MSRKSRDNVRLLKIMPTNQPVHFGDFDTEYALITPEMAREMLTHNVRNRRLYRHVVEKYANKMRSGQWRFVADPIRFDRDGRLIDGQHRLSACVLSETAFSAMIVRGLDPLSFDVIDTGKKRSAGDALSLRGQPSAFYMSAAARWLLIIKAGGPRKQSAVGIDNTDIIAMSLRHPLLIDSINKSHGSFGGGRLSLIAALHYIGVNFLDKPNEAGTFVNVFTDGVGYEGDPPLVWREHCLRARRAGATLNAAVVYPNLVTAFNWHLEGKIMKSGWTLRSGDVPIEGLDLSLL